ncbi:MAG: molybdenum cofactor biosynthesis protein MoaE [Bacteroidales bacterium]|nr:molybdenum cofactor biosynthesis protein MoaE [Bacteroidales bacterium]
MNKTLLVPGPVKSSLIAEYINKLSDDKSTGAHSIFLGQVRSDRINDRTVRAIEYSAYTEMLETEAGKIRETILSAFSDVTNLVIVHSTGLVKAGELSLFVMLTAGHRDQATRACRHVVEMIKEKFPVWKKEIFDDNTNRWHE